MRRILQIMVLTLMIPGVAMAQWSFEGAFPNDEFMHSTHGIAVDGEGKIWVANYFASETLERPNGSTVNVRAIYVFQPDGTEVDFSPITHFTVGGVQDTLLLPNVGLEADHQGNILASFGAAGGNALYRFNHQTGEAMNKTTLPLAGDGNPALTKAAVTDDGDIIITYVFGGNPILILDPDFNVIGNVVNEKPGFSRTIEVSPDGKTVYHTAYTEHAVVLYHSPDGVFGEYSEADRILQGMQVESAQVHPVTGNLWVSSGSYLNPPNQHPDVTSAWTIATWYAYDPDTGAIVDSLHYQFTTPGDPNERPRAIDFSVDGNTAYVGAFGTNSVPAVLRYVRSDASAIERDPTAVPERFALSQNYPNPFNPSTQISFDLTVSGHASLKVYDTLGREVAILVDGHLTSGSYKASFDGANLSTGVYVYVLSVDGQRASRTMMLMK